MLSEDVVSRYISPDCKLHSTRLLTKTNRMPKWGGFLFGGNSRFVSIVEESVVDPEKKTMTTYTRNIGYQNFMVRMNGRSLQCMLSQPTVYAVHVMHFDIPSDTMFTKLEVYIQKNC